MSTTGPDEVITHAAAWAQVGIQVLNTPYPYASGHVAMGPEDTDVTPQRLHPAFHGSLDWHSSVHMQWSLLRLIRTAEPQLRAGGQFESARDLLSDRLTAAAIEVETTYLRQRSSFERPYGWAWALMLAAEARQHPWLPAGLDRLVEVIVENTMAWLPRQAYPIRHGKHQNDAFALTLMLEASGADGIGRPELAAAIRGRALDWFEADRSAGAPTASEPSGSDFLSPTLTEAVLMRRVLGADFDAWWQAYLPGIGSDPGHRHLLQVPEIIDGSDGQFVHLAGLALSRAWQLRELAEHAEQGERQVLRDAAERQVQAVLPLITDGDFMATHWLVSFAILAAGGLQSKSNGRSR